MAEVQIHGSKENYSPPQIPHNVIAVVVNALEHNILKSPNIVDQYRERLWLDNEDEEELPPYESVSAETFVMYLDEIQDCDCLRGWSCSKLMQPCCKQRSCGSITGCSTFTTYDDFILFPSRVEISSKSDSSVVSCFTEDLSRSTLCTEITSDDSSGDVLPSSAQVSRTSMPKCIYSESHQVKTRSASKVAEWLRTADLDVGCTHPEHTFVQEGPTLTNTDEQIDVTHHVQESAV